MEFVYGDDFAYLNSNRSIHSIFMRVDLLVHFNLLLPFVFSTTPNDDANQSKQLPNNRRISSSNSSSPFNTARSGVADFSATAGGDDGILSALPFPHPCFVGGPDHMQFRLEPGATRRLRWTAYVSRPGVYDLNSFTVSAGAIMGDSCASSAAPLLLPQQLLNACWPSTLIVMDQKCT